MSRRKAGCTPRRIDPAPAANPDDETEMPDLVICVKPEPDARPLQAPGLGPFNPKEVPAPGLSEGESRHPHGPVPAAGLIHALGLRSQCAAWTPLTPNPQGERRLPLLRAHLPSPLPGGASFWGHRRRCAPPTPRPRGSCPFPIFLAGSWAPAPGF